MIYEPDVWVLLEIEGEKTPRHRRVLAGWYGGFSTGDSWRLSSAVNKIVFGETVYDFQNESGSTYVCAMDSEKLNMVTTSIYNDLKKIYEHVEIVNLGKDEN